MKKRIYAVAAAAAILAMGTAACSSKGSCEGKDCKKGDKTEVYTGVLPAADAAGVRYTLKLEFDDDNNYTEGDYDLVETYLTADSTANGGTTDGKTFTSEGDFSVCDATPATDGKKYLKLVQDAKDSQQGSATGPLYFICDSDSTLTLVNAELQRSETPGLNYTLKLSK